MWTGLFALAATASSGLQVNYQVVSSGGVATVSGNTVTLTGTEGSVTILAVQPGDEPYSEATPVYQTFVIVALASKIVKIARGPNANHVAAIRADGMLWAWGDNCAVQLGDGTRAGFARERASQEDSGLRKRTGFARGQTSC